MKIYKPAGRINIFISLIAFFCSELNAQTSVDSLVQLFEEIPGNSLEEIRKLNDIAKQNTTSYPSLAEKFAQKALKKSEELGYPSEIGYAYLHLSELYRTRSDLTQALEYGFSAFRIFEELKDSIDMAVAANNIGRYYFDIENLNEARKYYDLSLALNNKKDLKTDGNVLNNIGAIFQSFDNYDSAFKYYNDALEIRLEIKDKRGLARTYGNLASIYFRKFNNVSKSLELNYKSIEMKKELSDFFSLAFNFINLGNMYRDIKKYDSARYFYRTAVAYADSAEANGIKSAAYQRWARSEKRAGNIELSHEYEIKSYEIRMNVMQEREKSKIEQLTAAYNLEKKEQELIISNQKNLILQQDQRIMIVQIGLLVTALGLLLVIYFWQRSRNKKERELQETRNDLLKGELDHKNNELSSFTLNFIQKQDMMEELMSVVKQIKRNHLPEALKIKLAELDQIVSRQARNDKEWEDFRIYFEKVHSNFFKNLQAQYPDLSLSELRLSALIKMKLSIKESASVLGISPDSVKTARYRLRTKLGLEHDEKLTSFLLGF